MRKKVIAYLYRIPMGTILLWLFHRIIGHNRISLSKNNHFDSSTSNIYKNKIVAVNCAGNSIVIGHNSDLHNSEILIKGNNNTIQIGDNSFVNGLKIVIEGDNNSIALGNNVFILDNTRMYVVDGSCLTIGDGCMLSDYIDIRTTDNHAIFDRNAKNRINFESDIILHPNVWVGTRSIILKGTEIAEGCIVGAGSVVTHQHYTPHAIIAGNPARIAKENITWTMPRLREWDDSHCYG